LIKAANDKIIVRVNLDQKNFFSIDGNIVSTATQFDPNYRERSPVVACVVSGTPYVKEGEIVLCHHNTFYEPSPYFLKDDLFSIPAKGTILFAVVSPEGITPVYGNLICERVEKPSSIPLPLEQKEYYIDRSVVKDGGLTRYKSGHLLFHKPHAAYEIVYILNGVESRVWKLPEEQVVGYVP
jgi:hypothetical protein